MTGTELRNLFDMMGCRTIKESNTHVMASCPFAPFTHDGGMDKRPSFSVTKDSDKSIGQCFTCGEKGTILQIAKSFADRSGSQGVIDYVRECEIITADFKETFNAKTFGMRFRKLIDMNFADGDWKPEEFDEKSVEVMDWTQIERYMGSVPKYILHRGIDIGVCKKWKIGHAKQRKAVVFPMIDRLQRLVGYTLRKYQGLPKYLHSTGMKKSLFLYGEHMIMSKTDKLFIVEGHIDVLKMSQFGFSVLGIQGSDVSDIQAEKILDVTEANGTIYIMSDGDSAGDKLAIALKNKLEKRAFVKRVPLDNGKDPGDFNSREEVLACIGHEKL